MKCSKCGNKEIPKIEGKFVCKNRLPNGNICYNEMIISFHESKGKNYSEHMRKQNARKHKKSGKR